jgi:hypothetical protein
MEKALYHRDLGGVGQAVESRVKYSWGVFVVGKIVSG